MEPISRRRLLLMAPVLSAVVAFANKAGAGAINLRETFVVQPNDIRFEPWQGLPSASGEMAMLYGNLNQPGPYLVLMKWNPGWFSAPHDYRTDRICVVVSGTWWVNSGADFTPQQAVPVLTGGYVLRQARTWHYDGVPADTKEPAVIALFRDRSGRYPVGGSQATILAEGLGLKSSEMRTSP